MSTLTGVSSCTVYFYFDLDRYIIKKTLMMCVALCVALSVTKDKLCCTLHCTFIYQGLIMQEMYILGA